MDLNYTSELRMPSASRGARVGSRRTCPAEPLASFDTKEGFDAHRGVGAQNLNGAGYAMVPWPVEYGGRGANLLEWLIFEEEYYRAGAPEARQPERDLPARSHDHGVRHAGTAARASCRRWRLPKRSGPGVVGAERGQRHGQHPDDRHQGWGPLRRSTARRPGRRGARTPTGCSACSAPTRSRSGTGG